MVFVDAALDLPRNWLQVLKRSFEAGIVGRHAMGRRGQIHLLIHGRRFGEPDHVPIDEIYLGSADQSLWMQKMDGRMNAREFSILLTG